MRNERLLPIQTGPQPALQIPPRSPNRTRRQTSLRSILNSTSIPVQQKRVLVRRDHLEHGPLLRSLLPQIEAQRAPEAFRSRPDRFRSTQTPPIAHQRIGETVQAAQATPGVTTKSNRQHKQF